MSKIILDNNIFDTLLAITSEEQAQGLMNKSWPPPIMTFLYKNSDIRSFWMYKTPSPLDIVFCNNNKIIHIAQGEPNSTKLIYSLYPCSLVVELPQNTCNSQNIKIGSNVRLLLSKSDAARLVTTPTYTI
jgi:uncharacterized membrane protein (UPF0127 family)